MNLSVLERALAEYAINHHSEKCPWWKMETPVMPLNERYVEAVRCVLGLEGRPKRTERQLAKQWQITPTKVGDLFTRGMSRLIVLQRHRVYKGVILTMLPDLLLPKWPEWESAMDRRPAQMSVKEKLHIPIQAMAFSKPCPVQYGKRFHFNGPIIRTVGDLWEDVEESSFQYRQYPYILRRLALIGLPPSRDLQKTRDRARVG